MAADSLKSELPKSLDPAPVGPEADVSGTAQTSSEVSAEVRAKLEGPTSLFLKGIDNIDRRIEESGPVLSQGSFEIPIRGRKIELRYVLKCIAGGIDFELHSVSIPRSPELQSLISDCSREELLALALGKAALHIKGEYTHGEGREAFDYHFPLSNSDPVRWRIFRANGVRMDQPFSVKITEAELVTTS